MRLTADKFVCIYLQKHKQEQHDTAIIWSLHLHKTNSANMFTSDFKVGYDISVMLFKM